MRRHQFASIRGHAAGLLIAAVMSSIAAGQDAPPGRRAAPADGPPRKADRHGDPLPPGAVVRLGTVQHRQDTPIEQIVYSPDGRFLATDGDDASVRIWDGGDGRFVRRIEVGAAELRALAFSPDSRTLAVAGYRLDPVQLAYVVDITYAEVASGSRIVRGPWPEQDSVSALALSPDHGLLATATTGGTLRFRDARSGDEAGRSLIGRREIRRIVFAASGGRLAALSHDDGDPRRAGRVDVFEPRRKAAPRVIPDIKSARNVALSPDGNLLIISDKYMMDWRDVGSGQDVGNGHLWGRDAAFSADGRLVAAFDWPSVRIHDLSTGQLVTTFECPTSSPTAWAFSPDGASVAASGGPTTLHLWDVRTGRDRLAAVDAHSEPVCCLLFSADGKTVVTGGDDRAVRIWDAASGECRKVLNLAGKPRTLTLSPDGRLLIAGAEDNGWLFTWDLAAGAGTKPIILLDRINSPGYPLAVRYSPADRTILAAWSDGRLLAGERESGKLRAGKPAKFVDESPLEMMIEANRFRSGVSFAGGARLGVVRCERGLWVADFGTGRKVWEFDGATIVAAAPDQRTLAVAVQRDDPYYQPESWRVDREAPRRRRAAPDPDAAGASIVLLDGETGKETRRIPLPGTIVWGLAFAPDGKTLAATCGRAGGQVRLYAIATGRPVGSFSTPPISGPVVAFSPDGSRLATAMADTSVLLWDPRPGP